MSTVTLGHPGPGQLQVRQGEALLSGLRDGPGLAAHERRYAALPRLAPTDLAGLAESVDLRGRGGAGFPFARKLTTTSRARGRAVVVVNLSEGEPPSHKDAALAQVSPHLVLDGAAVTAQALVTTDVHVVLPGETPAVGAAVRGALAERSIRRRDGRIRWTLHEASETFVAGQSSAVLELMAGRHNLPVTTWRPSAEAGHRRRPTLLSNAETFAQVARLALLGLDEYRSRGTRSEPGTTLLTVDGDGAQGHDPVVLEVPFGTPWTDVVGTLRVAAPVLLGGYHGSWAAPGRLASAVVSAREPGLTLGAGAVLPLDTGCPVERTSEVTAYLASQSARRCGPCLNGLPALASALSALALGSGGVEEVERLNGLIHGRGACAHPDGTVRLVRSMMTVFADEVAVHARGACRFRRTSSQGRVPRLEVSA